MKIKDLLAPSDVLVDFAASNKRELLSVLAARAANGQKLSTDSVVSDIQKRDELGSTGIGGGVSIPHARLREVQRPCGLLARLSSRSTIKPLTGNRLTLCLCFCCQPRRNLISAMRWPPSHASYGIKLYCGVPASPAVRASFIMQ